MQFISAKLCVSAASALNVAAIIVNAESTETQRLAEKSQKLFKDTFRARPQRIKEMDPRKQEGIDAGIKHPSELVELKRELEQLSQREQRLNYASHD